ncbi:hypothetical protein V1478_006620 [Vespula squamosa]|uniref:Uncharacterized protein n=1 Tax=Vespula squamosa TaxID=30214 RepID=A0ABD2B8V6_VESSQ
MLSTNTFINDPEWKDRYINQLGSLRTISMDKRLDCRININGISGPIKSVWLIIPTEILECKFVAF